MAKFYMMEFTDKKTGKKFHKFGWTNHSDALNRFARPEYADFDIKCLASLKHESEAVVKAYEAAFLCLFPKNIILEEYLGDERTWNNFSGITEIVVLDENKYKQAINGFYKLKRKLENATSQLHSA